MFKSFLITVLSIALLLCGFVTRPSERSARGFLANDREAAQPDGPKTVGTALKDAIIKSADVGEKGVPDGLVFKDRGLWVEVQDTSGRTLYTGALAHWVKHEPPPAATPGKPGEAPIAAVATTGR
ncbi:MAG TPA: hypothetical protein VF796_26960 [Humisphaera sp.]